MLTRLRVRGFKNLVDAEFRFGAFTCLAGPNGLGKSNVFDAIRFLSLLADRPFVEAASGVRGGDELEGLFTKGGDGRMALACDVLIPSRGRDDFNQIAEAASTFLRYSLELRMDRDSSRHGVPQIRLCHEELSYITKSQARDMLGFPHTDRWRDSVVRPTRRGRTFIATEQDQLPDGGALVKLQLDRMRDPDRSHRGGGKPTAYALNGLPRTALSSAQNAEETRTAVLLRQEMRSWRQLQLEPSALRRPDDFGSPQRIDAAGAHVPATLFRLASASDDPDIVYAGVANRLAELVDGVRTVHVDRDDGRKLFRLLMTDSHGVELPASALSDGTLRFIALSVMEQDPDVTGILCLEEPENGIHPQRVAAMLRLLNDMSVNTQHAVGADNPLRQTIVTTHSPVVVAIADPNDVVFARPARRRVGDRTVQTVEFAGIDGYWRATDRPPMPDGALGEYILSLLGPASAEGTVGTVGTVVRLVTQKMGLQLQLPLERHN